MLDALQGKQHKQANLDTRRMRDGIVNMTALAVGGSSSKKIKRIGSVTLGKLKAGSTAETVIGKLAKLRSKAKRSVGGINVSRSRTYRKDKAKPAFYARTKAKRRKVWDSV
jgi:hypothetical protein